MLSVFSNEIVEYVIAESEYDAAMVMNELTGEYYNASDSGEWTKEADEKKLSVWVEGDIVIPADGVELKDETSLFSGENAKLIEATCRQWADANGRCMLCSTVY